MFKYFVLILAFLTTAQVFAEDNHKHWQYEGSAGPEHWGKLDKGFELCDIRIGKHQSPINIETDKLIESTYPLITLSYQRSPAAVVNNGHTVQIDLNDGGELKVSSKTYKLLQLHFHTPSEEAINGRHYPMVAHLVHKNTEGELAVIGLFFNLGAKNKPLASIFENLPEQKGHRKQLSSFDPASLLPHSLAHYAYQGSLTTPHAVKVCHGIF